MSFSVLSQCLEYRLTCRRQFVKLIYLVIISSFINWKPLPCKTIISLKWVRIYSYPKIGEWTLQQSNFFYSVLLCFSQLCGSILIIMF